MKKMDRCHCSEEAGAHYQKILLDILASPNVAGKHWFVRQFGSGVQGNATVIRPRPDSQRGLVISHGMNPMYSDIDTYAMAASAIDEAVRNAVCVGADPKTIVLLDNFCWGNTDNPETLGTLVRAAQACYDTALAYEMPFISGKDSLNNEYRPAVGEPISIPPTLLISAMGQIDDMSKCVTMELKKAGNVLFYLAGTPAHETADGERRTADREPPTVSAVVLYTLLHSAIMRSLVRSAHDLSAGGLAVAITDMCIAGGLGAKLEPDFVLDAASLFGESNSRFVIEVAPEHVAEVETQFAGWIFKLGTVTAEKELSFGDVFSVDVDELESVWRKPMDW